MLPITYGSNNPQMVDKIMLLDTPGPQDATGSTPWPIFCIKNTCFSDHSEVK